MIPARLGPVLFGFILSGLMSLIVSGVATLRVVGVPEDFLNLWVTSWLPSWLVAFPSVLFVAPIARRLVARLVKAP